MRKILAVVLLVCFLAAPALAKEVGGVTVPDSVSAGGKSLVLNGTGVRKKFGMVKVYAGALYLGQKSSDAEKIIASDEPMALVMAWIKDGVEKAAVSKAWHEGFARAMNGNTAPLKAQIETFDGCFPAVYKKKDVYKFVYEPGVGTTVEINGQKKTVIPGLAFKKALFGNYLGSTGSDGGLATLKTGLLGK